MRDQIQLSLIGREERMQMPPELGHSFSIQVILVASKLVSQLIGPIFFTVMLSII
jgi:hypothetical protein